MIFSVRCKKVWSGYILFGSFEIKFITYGCVFNYCDYRGFTLFTLWTLNALLALFTGIAFFTLWSGTTHIALNALRTYFTLTSLFSPWALRTYRTHGALNSNVGAALTGRTATFAAIIICIIVNIKSLLVKVVFYTIICKSDEPVPFDPKQNTF